MYVSYHLFLKPGNEIQEGSTVSGNQLLELSDVISKRLGNAKYLVEVLERVGFIPHMGKYELLFDHKELENQRDLEMLIESVGLDYRIFDFVEDENN